MNVDIKYCIEITIFIYNYIMVEIIPLKIQSENLKVKNNVRIFLTAQILPYYSQIRTRFRELHFIGNCGNKTKIYKMTTSTLLKKLSKTLSLYSSRRCLFSSSKIYTKIEVFPKHSLADERLTSTILSDLKPFQKGKIFQNLYRMIFFVSLSKIIFQLY